MSIRSLLAVGAALVGLSPAAQAGLLTDSYATWIANVSNPSRVVNTQTTGLPANVATSNLVMFDGTTFPISPSVITAQPFNGFGSYWSTTAFTGDIFPTSAYVVSETITIPSYVQDFGFEVAASYALGDRVTVTASNGQSITDNLGGLNTTDFTVPVQFFGIAGGGISSITITSARVCTGTNGGTDCGFAIANFSTVPEPATVALLAPAMLAGFAAVRRRA